jgi:hypothetical protein
MRVLVTTLLLMGSLTFLKGQLQLSSKATISVLTCSAGEELYSAFGHSAIRVKDPEQNMDLVFNYGTFDFNTPNFYIKFTNGKLNYMLSVGNYKSFLASYFYANRSVYEQRLRLSLNDKQNVFNALLENYQPQNRFYKYDFFYDNCATKILDILLDNVESEISLNMLPVNYKDHNFRDYLHYYLAYSPWIETGINMILGLPADKIATVNESAFLPDFLMKVVENSTVKHPTNSGEQKTLVESSGFVLETEPAASSEKKVISPTYWFWLLLIAGIIGSFFTTFWHRYGGGLDRLIFFIVGVIGLLISYLGVVTDHEVTACNLNILCTIPTFLYLAIANWKSKSAQLIMRIHIILITFFWVAWYWLPQSFPVVTLPLAIFLTIRLVMILRYTNVKNAPKKAK